jgi:hypothetical protein
MGNNGLPILDCHQHFFDARRLRYPVFAQRSAGFEALVDDYSALPRAYLPEDYERDAGELNVVKTVWAEFMSDDRVSEVSCAEELAQATGRPNGVIALIDFPSPDLDRTLDVYKTMLHIRCVRQHLGWPQRRSRCLEALGLVPALLACAIDGGVGAELPGLASPRSFPLSRHSAAQPPNHRHGRPPPKNTTTQSKCAIRYKLLQRFGSAIGNSALLALLARTRLQLERSFLLETPRAVPVVGRRRCGKNFNTFEHRRGGPVSWHRRLRCAECSAGLFPVSITIRL